VLLRAGAKKHALAAKAAAAEALGPGPAETQEPARETALREVGRALALDPENETALATFVELLTSAPKVVPREVVEEDAVAIRRRLRMGGIAAACLYGYITVNAITTLSLGVRNVFVFTICHVGWAIALALSIAAAVRPSYKLLTAMLVTGVTTSVYLTNVYGPYLIVPMLLGVHAALFALVREWQLRLLGLVVTCIGWTVSIFGERLGLFPKVLGFEGGNLVMRSPVIDLPEGMMTFFMYSAVLVMILAPALVIGSLRAASAKNELAARVQAWQLRKLIGDAKRP
jgi:eukaryotic-like serine/threonine-protein kinase